MLGYDDAPGKNTGYAQLPLAKGQIFILDTKKGEPKIWFESLQAMNQVLSTE